MASEEQVRQAMKELGIKEYKNTEKTSPAYKRAEKMLDEADLNKSRLENNKKGMEARLRQYAKDGSNSPAPQQQPANNRVGYGTEEDLDTLWNKTEDGGENSQQDNKPKEDAQKTTNKPKVNNTPKKTGNIADKLKNLNDKFNNSKVGKFTGGVGKLLGGLSAAQSVGGVFNPYADDLSRAYDSTAALGGITSLLTGGLGSLATGGGATYNANKAKEIRDMNKTLMDKEYADLVKAGIDPQIAFGSVFGNINPKRVGIDFANDRAFQRQYLASTSPEATSATLTQRKLSNEQPTNNKVDMKQKMQNEIAADAQNLPQAGGNMEQFINNQIAKYGGYNGGGMGNVPPEGMPMGDGQPMQPQAILPMQQTQPVQQDVQNAQAPQQADYAQQIMNMTPEGYVSAQDIMNKLNAAYANINQQINADPRYQGGIVQPNNPYNIDENKLRLAQQAAENYTRLTNPAQLPDVVTRNSQVLYEQQMANQLGVPYSDYINATLEQRKARISNEAQQMENALKLQAQQATDMKTRLEAMNKMQQLRNEVATEMYKADLDAQTKKDVAMLNAVGGIAKTQAFTNAPSTMMQAAGQYTANVAGTMGGNYMNAALWMMTPQQRGNLINGGVPVSDDELKAFFTSVGNVPIQFRSPNGQMPVQPTQQQGFLPSVAQWVWGNQ